jgi:tetratricopeptide (TPR) repeat protein
MGERVSGKPSVTLDDAFEAYLSGDIPQLAQICERGLAVPDLTPEREAPFRRLLAFALSGLSLEPGQDKARLRKRAIQEAQRAIHLYGESAEPLRLSESYEQLGAGLSLYSMTVEDSDEMANLLRQSIAAYERVLQLKPNNDDARYHLEKARERLAMINEEEPARNSGGCFVATAVYGSPMAPEVVTFRRFRDGVLLVSRPGTALVAFYYFVSPPLALIISKVPLLRIITREFLLEPILRLLKGIENESPSEWEERNSKGAVCSTSKG